MKKINTQSIESSVKEILTAIGEDPEREGLQETPKRVARMYEYMFSGLKEDPALLLETTFKDPGNKELILVKNITFYSMCEHHFMPFWGKAHIGYIPRDGVITGLSKLSRVVNTFARRPQIQERLTSQVADCIYETLNPIGVIAIFEAEHMCMSMRGVKNPGSTTTTSALRGVFHSNPSSRAEALSLILAK